MMKSSFGKHTLTAAIALAIFGTVSLPAQAIEFSSGEWTGSFDTTLSYGASWRLKDFDPENVGKQANNPIAFTLDKLAQRDVIGRWSANGDDGNLNYLLHGPRLSTISKTTTRMGCQTSRRSGSARK